MKRLHVNVSVTDLDQSIAFYNHLFASEPSVVKPDYAKWMLDDPRVNFAITTRGERKGVDHLGIQVENDEELPLKQYDKILFHPKNAIPVDLEHDNQLFVVPVEDRQANFDRNASSNGVSK